VLNLSWKNAVSVCKRRENLAEQNETEQATNPTSGKTSDEVLGTIYRSEETPKTEQAEKPAEAEEPVEAEKPAEEDKAAEPEDKDEEDKAEGDKDAPLKLELPEELGVDGSDKEALEGFISELNKEGADANKVTEKFVREFTERQQERITEALDAQLSQWAEAAKKDKEYGGENYDENMALAAKAIDKVIGKDFRKVLDETGMGSHPEFIRFAYRVGKRMADGDVFQTGGAKPEGRDNILDVIYNKQGS
jgi:hypothetical protein